MTNYVIIHLYSSPTCPWKAVTMTSPGLWRRPCAITALVFAFLWLFAVTISGFTAPAWVPPIALAALAVAVAL